MPALSKPATCIAATGIFQLQSMILEPKKGKQENTENWLLLAKILWPFSASPKNQLLRNARGCS
ncbi:hypothetical protein OEG84_14200 [Hoeflea sp. G2-23]|uniref:Uncharacterized protein n=1 Tax=Hoeflea algicola TaxID=2983763 RepID=A0ABT3ZBY3_9HYPH|nr:hypothetical protein [Hoeflea algicola]MCY0148819.1 hypothetical protein [Hoeflea algicola]